MEKKWFLDVVFSIRLPASVLNGGPKQEKNNNSQFLLESEILFMAQILKEFSSSYLPAWGIKPWTSGMRIRNATLRPSRH